MKNTEEHETEPDDTAEDRDGRRRKAEEQPHRTPTRPEAAADTPRGTAAAERKRAKEARTTRHSGQPHLLRGPETAGTPGSRAAVEDRSNKWG